MTEFRVSGVKIGNVLEFRWRFMQALIGLDMSLRVGDRVQIVGPETDFEQIVDEMRVDREKVIRGKPAQKVWVAVEARVRPGDAVVVLPRRSVETGPHATD